MQFIKGGPNIPERLLQAHEEGDVVFFCGAGISRSAGLPDFKDLVNEIFGSLEITPDKEQEAAIKACQYDTAIGLLEKSVGDRKKVRKQLVSILRPSANIKNPTATHESLLILGKDRKYLDDNDGRTRLVTTNFDRLFEKVIEEKYPSMERFLAPLLPIPKKSQWDGLVYLHGLLKENPTPSDLDRLVVSSGDFGLAYLTERWAARFVSELLRNYTVCFVGYSINDPILRYMMDALAADRLLGEMPLDMFAFGDYSKGSENDVAKQWKAKNVIPILYRKHQNHFYLRKTLHAWADIYRNGVRGKEQIVVELARARPSNSTQEDDFVGRMLWALSDSSGLPAMRFAEFNPAPSFEWLKYLSEDRYLDVDLRRFDILPNSDSDKVSAFSMIRRPSPYSLAPLMSIVDKGAQRSDWDKVMYYLGCWLINHLDDPKLLLWFAKQGGQLHEKFIWLIEDYMDKSSNPSSDSERFEQIRSTEKRSSKTLNPFMRKLWGLMLAGRIISRESDTGIDKHHMYHWCERFKRDGLTLEMRLKLRENLTPRVLLHEPIYRSNEENDDESKDIRYLVDWMIVLSVDHVHRDIKNLSDNEQWVDCLPELLSDFTGLLQDALDLMWELGVEDGWNEQSHVYQPSISKHSQNRGFRDWTALIELTRDAWLAMSEKSSKRAVIEAERWWSMPYPVFRRLSLFAAAQGTVISTRRALDWLLADSCRWLWSEKTGREVMLLLVALAPRLGKKKLAELEQAILAGPPSDISSEGVSPDAWDLIVDRKIWLRLAKISEAKVVLGEVAKNRLGTLSARYPDWKLAENQRDEFSSWIDIDRIVPHFILIPRELHEMIDYIKDNSVDDFNRRDDWRQCCRDDFDTTSDALRELAKKGDWPSGRWQEALHVWSEEEFIQKSWDKLAPILIDIPRDTLKNIANDASRWILSVAKIFEDHKEIFFAFIDQILKLNHEDYTGSNNSFDCAINHPVGIVTEALMLWWHRESLRDDQGLPDERLKNIFSRLCDREVRRYRYGRVLLATYAVTLYRIDVKWTESNLLPLFSWRECPDESRLMWGGFLWSPRLYLPLMDVFKDDFLETLDYLSKLSRMERVKYVAFLIFFIINSDDKSINVKLRGIVGELPDDIIHVVFDELGRLMDSSNDRRVDFWSNRIVPCIKIILPKERDKISPVIVNNISIFCIDMKDQFPEAVDLLCDWLMGIENIGYQIYRLYESELCSTHPEPALDFLSYIISDKTRDLSLSHLRGCLDAIIKSDDDLRHDARYRKLDNYLLESGGR